MAFRDMPAASPMPAARAGEAAVRAGMDGVARYWPAALVTILALVRIFTGELNADNSWLITVGQNWLAGGVPYRDIVEVNPPASVLLYLPAIPLAGLLGISPETSVRLEVLALAAASLGLAGFVLRRAGLSDRQSGPWLAALAAAIFLLLPGYVFAQREHVATFLVLPVLAVYAAQALGQRIGISSMLGAGLAGGLCVVIKPYFALALLLPLGLVCLGLRHDLRRLAAVLFSPTNLLIGTCAVLYAGAVVMFFPAFVDEVLPLVVTIYVPVRQPLAYLLIWLPLSVAPTWLLLRYVEPAGQLDIVSRMLLLSAGGFIVAMLIQAKGWPYHFYPFFSLCLLALGRGLVLAVCDGKLRWPSSKAILVLGACLVLATPSAAMFSVRSYSATIVREVAALGLHKPAIFVLGADIATGHPLTRAVGGIWIDRFTGRWVTQHATMLLGPGSPLGPEERLRAETYLREDLAVVQDALSRRKPEIVLVETAAWNDWIAATPGLPALLQPYRTVAEAEGIAVLLRSDLRPVADAAGPAR